VGAESVGIIVRRAKPSPLPLASALPFPQIFKDAYYSVGT
jgi:hypothetical protein